VSPSEPAEAPAIDARRSAIEEQLAALVTAELIEEHRVHPRGTHSPALALVLSYFAQAPVRGKLALIETFPDRRYRLVRLSGEQGAPHESLDLIFDSERAAAHAAFLHRLAEIGVDATLTATNARLRDA
jgi:hypothetical protein